MHLEHMNQSSKANDYYSRPLTAVRPPLPIDNLRPDGRYIVGPGAAGAAGAAGLTSTDDDGGDGFDVFDDDDDVDDDVDDVDGVGDPGHVDSKRRRGSSGVSPFDLVSVNAAAAASAAYAANTPTSSSSSSRPPKREAAVAKEKNREHAKNTRIRKKLYIEALKESVRLLTEEREKVERDRRVAIARLSEQTTVRRQVLQTLLYFRSSAEMDPQRWRTVVEENVVFTLPIAPYRSFPPAEVVDGQRRVVGIDALIADTASLATMIQSVGKPRADGATVTAQYYCSEEDSIIAGDVYMSKCLLRTGNRHTPPITGTPPPIREWRTQVALYTLLPHPHPPPTLTLHPLPRPAAQTTLWNTGRSTTCSSKA